MWTVTGTVRSVGPSQHHRDELVGNAAAFGDELGLAGMGEADRVELRLGDRAGDQPRRRARAGQADARSRARRARCARPRRSGAPGMISTAVADLEHAASAVAKQSQRLGGIVDGLDRARPDRVDRGAIADREEGREALLRRRLSQLLAMISGPIPAGSPSATARGSGKFSCLSDNRPPRRGAGRAGSALRAAIDPLLVELRRRSASNDRTVGARRIVAAAQDEHADALGDRAERRRRLADVEAEQHLLQRRRQIAHADLVVGDDLGADLGRGRLGAAAAAHRLRGVERAGATLRLASFCVVPGGKLIESCIRLSTASRGSAIRIWRLSCTARIEKPPGTRSGR